MNEISRRLSVTELTQRILEMAKTGVYRESLLTTFKPLATQQQIRQAIRHAKQFGLHSVAQMRDAELGTYYQVDVVQYEAAKPTLQAAIPLTEADILQRLTAAIAVLRVMLMLAGSGAIALGGVGVFCLATGEARIGWGLMTGAICTGSVWLMQRGLAQKLLR